MHIESFQCLELYIVANGQSGSESLLPEVMPENPQSSISIGELNQLNHNTSQSDSGVCVNEASMLRSVRTIARQKNGFGRNLTPVLLVRCESVVLVQVDV